MNHTQPLSPQFSLIVATLGLAQGAPAKARFDWNVLRGRLTSQRARE